MRIEKGILSKYIQDKYDYISTKKEVYQYISDTLVLEYQIKNMEFSPRVSTYGFGEHQFIRSRNTREEKFVIIKEELENEYKTRKAKLNNLIEKNFIDLEKQIYIYSFEEGMTDEEIAEKERSYTKKIGLIKKSAILKLGIGLSIAIPKEIQKNLKGGIL